jgi:hypothetical protein
VPIVSLPKAVIKLLSRSRFRTNKIRFEFRVAFSADADFIRSDDFARKAKGDRDGEPLRKNELWTLNIQVPSILTNIKWHNARCT